MNDVMLAAFRHDAHKFTGESHDDARETFAGVSVNQAVPEGADRDAAALSRPQQTQERTVPTHDGRPRLSLLTGDPVYDHREFSQGVIESDVRDLLTERGVGVAVDDDRVESDVRDLLTIETAEGAHEQWLKSDVAAGFNESVYHPYTSLKYHTLLVAALLDNYRNDVAFTDLQLIVDTTDEIEPFRTIFDGERFALHIDADSNGRPSARLGSRPWRSWAATWSRLTAHPLDTDCDKYDMTLDANLRRIRSWSTALQYLEDFAEWRPDR